MTPVIVTALICLTVSFLGVLWYRARVMELDLERTPEQSQVDLAPLEARVSQLSDEVSSHSVALGMGIRK